MYCLMELSYMEKHTLQAILLLREPLFVSYPYGVSILINIHQSTKLSHTNIVFAYVCIYIFLVESNNFRHTVTTAVFFVLKYYYYILLSSSSSSFFAKKSSIILLHFPSLSSSHHGGTVGGHHQ